MINVARLKNLTLRNSQSEIFYWRFHTRLSLEASQNEKIPGVIIETVEIATVMNTP